MSRMKRVTLSGFQLALWGALGCASDPNVIIGAGGAPAAGGAAPVGGAAPMGGAAPIAGTGGQSTQGGSEPGLAGAGGASAGSSGSGGSAGGAMAGASSICTASGNQFDCNNVLGGFDGYASLDMAAGKGQGPDCLQPDSCKADENNPKIWKEGHWQLIGAGIEVGKSYKVELHFYGVVECKTYKLQPNVDGPAKTESTVKGGKKNLWMPQATEPVKDHWNTYAFTVTPTKNSQYLGIGAQDMAPPAANSYVINQCPGNQGEAHYTYAIDFVASITVPGGSWINYIEYDTNCRLINNCGAAEASTTCPGPYNVVDLKDVVPQTNSKFAQPLANNENPPARGQWWVVDVTKISAM